MGDPVLKITEKNQNGVCVITLSGDIDAYTAPSFKDAIDKKISAGTFRIVFDFSGVNYISSAAIGVLNAALHTLKANGGAMSIACVNKTVRDTLDVMYFTRKVTVTNSLDTSINEVSAS